MYYYKSLNDISYNQIAACFNLAFSDYYLPIQFTGQELQNYFAISGADRNVSYGAFSNGEMVGFIFNSCNIYNNHKAVFDIGTGVVPEHRGNKVFTNLFSYAEQELKKQHIEKYYLEVLQQNDKAISSYQKQGFTIIRNFSILQANGNGKRAINTGVEYIPLHDFDWDTVGHCNCLNPSYEHSINILKINPNLYNVACRKENDKISAFCIFSKQNGSIVQLGYSDINTLKLIVRQLLSEFNHIIVKNIDVNYSSILEMLHSINFSEVARQFEMVKTIYDNQ